MNEPPPQTMPLCQYRPDAALRHRLHYQFAHRFIPDWATYHGRRFLTEFLLPRADGSKTTPTDYAQLLWRMMEDLLDLRTPEAPMPWITDLSGLSVKLDGRLGLLIEMPPLEGPTEAIFIMVVAESTGSPADWPEKISTRVFTLERGVDEEGSRPQFGLLCEWKEGSRHVNHRRRVPVDVRTFAQEAGRVAGWIDEPDPRQP